MAVLHEILSLSKRLEQKLLLKLELHAFLMFFLHVVRFVEIQDWVGEIPKKYAKETKWHFVLSILLVTVAPLRLEWDKDAYQQGSYHWFPQEHTQIQGFRNLLLGRIMVPNSFHEFIAGLTKLVEQKFIKQNRIVDAPGTQRYSKRSYVKAAREKNGVDVLHERFV
ncbi:hypothetical protein MKW98_010091 [Papaver atlanticum]|uniref:Uncharacterized protein n=1 Tax=Papaver atlanticum TaxID=357466 RepID=A0AAD4RXF9_9MAGN|nr:hypothetical protein MKW98_010091 [Papaver atlanticum]